MLPIWALKVSHSPSTGPLGIFCWFVLLNFKNFEKLVPTITNVLHYFILQLFKPKTFFNVGQGKCIINFINWVDETNYLLLFWVIEHEDDHCQLVNPNFQHVDGHFFYRIFVIIVDEMELYQRLMCKHQFRPTSQYAFWKGSNSKLYLWIILVDPQVLTNHFF